MKWFGMGYRKQLFFLGLVLLTFLVVIRIIPVAAQYPYIPKTHSSLNEAVQGNPQALKFNDAPTLLTHGQSNYDAGRFADAAIAYQQALDRYEQAGDRLNQALSLNHLSLAYQEWGQWKQAQAAIHQSLNLLQTQSNAGILAQALNTQGSLQLATGQTEAAISTKIPSEILLNEKFTRAALENRINALPVAVVHLATHGECSSNPEKTFLLTWDERLNVDTLSQLLTTREQKNSQPIELLILSACQTARGDKRAALGLAGLAVRSGVRSTLATLWSVNDQSTAKTIVEFYQNLVQRDVNRAEALRQAQLSLLKQKQYQHPYYWAPFVLVGNWL